MKPLTTAELTELAKEALTENGFAPDFSPIILEAAEKLEKTVLTLTPDSEIQDLRQLLWSSIDDKSSRDLDQVEYTETLPNGDIRLLVGIADVDKFVVKDSAIDAHAERNTVSIYAGNKVFPMLPEQLSTDLTSLLNDVDRFAVVIEMIIGADGEVSSSNVFRAFIRNYAKLAYEEIGAWLDENAEIPEGVTKISGMEAQILLQQETASRLYKFRQQHGALEFETVETAPVIKEGNITNLKISRPNSARRIIENFMIAANVTMAEFLENHHSISLRRVVKTPERWNQNRRSCRVVRCSVAGNA